MNTELFSVMKDFPFVTISSDVYVLFLLSAEFHIVYTLSGVK